MYVSVVIGIIMMRTERRGWGRAWILKVTYVYIHIHCWDIII